MRPLPMARPAARGWGEGVSDEQDKPMAWISVKHRLPTHHHSVLGFVVRGGMVAGRDDPMFDIVSYGGPSDPRWLQFIGDAGDAVVKVTHWMELPDRPDGEKA